MHVFEISWTFILKIKQLHQKAKEYNLAAGRPVLGPKKDFLEFPLLRKLLSTEQSEERTYFALTLATGFCSAFIAVGMDKSVRFLTHYFGTSSTFTLKALIFGLVATFISGWITTRKFPGTSGSGIPGVRMALAVFNGKLPFLDTIAKFFVTILSLSAGFSLGREGPTVAVCSALGSNVGQFFQMSKKRIKSLLAIGSASGMAAAFNTPIAAVVFTLEEIVGDLNARMLGSIVIASVVAAITAQAIQGGTNSFESMNYAFRNYKEIFFFIAVGISSSLSGVLWVKIVLFYRKFSLNFLKGHKLGLIMVTFLLMAGLSFIEPKALGMGHSSIEELVFSLIYDWRILLSLFVFKFIASILCYGSGISGGLFMPVLLLGASLGGLLGSLSTLHFGDAAPAMGAMAIIGMGSFFAAVTRSPFTSILMVFELTRDYDIIIPLMISNILSFGLASALQKGSIYENVAEQDGAHLPTKEDNEVLESLTVEEAMIKEPITLSANISIKDALQKVRSSNISGFPVLKEGNLIGIASSSDIGSAFAKRKKGMNTIEDICTKNVIKIYPDQSLLVAFHKLQQYQISRLPVVSRLNDKKLVGIITAEDIVNKFGYQLHDKSALKNKERSLPNEDDKLDPENNS